MADETNVTSEVARVLAEAYTRFMFDPKVPHMTRHLAEALAGAGLLRDGSHARLSDLTARIGFGDGVTEPQADNDTIVKFVNEAMTNSNTLWEVEEQVERVRALAQWFRDQGLDGYARKVEEAVEGMGVGSERDPECSCAACDPGVIVDGKRTGFASRMNVCPDCGNKRCPKAANHAKWQCSGSNEVGQVGVPIGSAP